MGPISIWTVELTENHFKPETNHSFSHWVWKDLIFILFSIIPSSLPPVGFLDHKGEKKRSAKSPNICLEVVGKCRLHWVQVVTSSLKKTDLNGLTIACCPELVLSLAMSLVMFFWEVGKDTVR